MITLIHGENTKAARDRFLSVIEAYKTKGYGVALVDPLREMAPQLTGNSLFSGKTVFVLENPKKLASKIEKSTDLVLLCDGNAPITLTKTLPRETKIEKFDLPKRLFVFLESLYPKNAKNILSELHKLIETEPLELVFFMIGRQFRDLYWVLTDEKTMGLPAWRAGKLKNQAERFSKDKLKIMISVLSDMDYKAKTGEADLMTSLDLMIARELE